MGDIRAGLDELKLDVALFADVKFYVTGRADPKVILIFLFTAIIIRNCDFNFQIPVFLFFIFDIF